MHKLAGIDAVRERFGLVMAREPEMKTETDFRQPEPEIKRPQLSQEELMKTIIGVLKMVMHHWKRGRNGKISHL